MRIQIVLTGPPRVLLGRSTVDIDLGGLTCTLRDLIAALVDSEPRLARYLSCADGNLPPAVRPLLHDRVISPETCIPDGAAVTLLYAATGG